MENLYTPNSIRTRSGKYVNLITPDPETLDINDIAFALSNQPRFGGHLPCFYSVAQHSIMGTKLIKNKFKFDFLMHDASEAYLLDIPKPLKDLLPEYRAIEENMMWALSKKFNFTYPLPDEVKRCDEMMLNYEWENIMLNENSRRRENRNELVRREFIELFQKYKR